MKLILEVPYDYPQAIPHVQLKNLSPEFLDNAMLDKFECSSRVLAHENEGNTMIFDLVEHCREQIADINDGVLGKFNKINEEREAQIREDNAPRISNVNHLNYTPVNNETFSKWCDLFMWELRKKEESEKTEADLRQTGKEIFMEAGGLAEVEDLEIDEGIIEDMLNIGKAEEVKGEEDPVEEVI